MLFLHCGWPRTGTTSFQAAMLEHRELLQEAGIVYPDRWLNEGGFAHHPLNELLDGAAAVEELIELRRFLDVHADSDVLCSAESLTGRLRSEDRTEALLALLATARESMPVTCLWTLRRVDEMLSSGYLMMLRLGGGAKLPPPAEYLGGDASPHSGRTFERMRQVEAAAGAAVYLRYRPDGRHNRELLDALGLAGAAAEELSEAVERGRRRNASPRQKEAAVLANPEALSRRTGTQLDPMTLCRTFARGDFRFEQDWPCELVEQSVKETAHRRALAAARDQGFAPYSDLFGDDELGMASPVTGLDPEILTDEDLERLLAHLDLARSARPAPNVVGQ